MQKDKSSIHRKYIYLDWNVVKYMKSHRNAIDEYFTSLIFNIAKKDVYFLPYSEAHIKDRANHYDPTYRSEIIKDFTFFERLNNSMCLGVMENTSNFSMVPKKMIEFFDEYIQETATIPKNELDFKGHFPSFIQLDKVDSDNPLFELVAATNGSITENDMADFLKKQFNVIFQDADAYKKLRNYAPNINVNSKDAFISYITIPYARELFLHLSPFINSLKFSEDELLGKWKGICESWLSLNKQLPISKAQLLIQGYMLLDVHPLFYDKLKKKKNTLNNIIHDGTHVYYASEAEYFVSEDVHTRKKAAFLYAALDIKTKVLSEKELLEIMSVQSNSPISL